MRILRLPGILTRFFEDLYAGDPVALGFVAVFAVAGAAFGLYILKVRRDLRREDDERARRYGKKK